MLGWHLAPARLGEAAVPETPHGGRIRGQPADGLRQPWVVPQGPAVAVGPLGHPHQPLQRALHLRDVHNPEHPPLVTERTLAHGPSVIELAEQILLRHLDVGEEDLVEVGMVGVGQLGQGPAHNAGGAHVDEQHTDATVFRHLGVGAHVTHAEIGLVGA